MYFYETSAKTRDNVDKIFMDTSLLVLKKIESKEIDPLNEREGIKLGPAH